MIAATAAALMASDGSIETTEQSVDAGMAAPSFEIVDDEGGQHAGRRLRAKAKEMMTRGPMTPLI